MSRPGRSGAGVTAVSAGLALSVVAALTPAAGGAFQASITDSGTTGSAGYFTCTAAAVGEAGTRATFAYPFSDTGLLTRAGDVSGNNNPGAFTLLGVTYGVANGGNCPRDDGTVITLDGSSGHVAGPATGATAPTVFSVETWFRTTVAGGGLIGFAGAQSGLDSTDDRHVYLDTAGRLVFGIRSGTNQVLTSPLTYTDGRWHHVVATLSPAGEALYADGALVASNPAVTTAQTATGHWRIGSGTVTGWVGSDGSSYAGNLAFAATYAIALSAAQVAAHFRAGTA